MNSYQAFILIITASLLLCWEVQSASTSTEIDSYGYVVYCPCMGRFGNQADHLLGSLSFAKKLNRTLVLPPFISHGSGSNGYTPFKELFDMNEIAKYHKTIDMGDFMEDLAPLVWPPGKRDIYCHSASIGRSKDKKSCPAKEGSPFGPFWDGFNVDFDVSYSFKGGLSYHSGAAAWNKEYPVDEHPVLAFMGAPASYPVLENDRKIQTYIEWTASINSTVSNFVKKKVKGPYVGIHLRNGLDWVRACEHIPENGLDYPFMSSPQCTGYARWSHTDGKRATPLTFTKEMCLPSHDHIKNQVMSAVEEHNARSLFIATDNHPMVSEFKKLFKDNNVKVKIVRYDENNLTMDMGVLIEADHFIGTCASSVTAFVVRKREILDRSNSFFGVFPKAPVSHEEL